MCVPSTNLLAIEQRLDRRTVSNHSRLIMLYEFETVMVAGLKQASDGLAATRAIMQRIYNENPDHWPYGLAPEMCDGGCYLMRKAGSHDPVGFVGWQERNAADGRKIGYYAVGVLPEYRQQGFAKAAVAQLIAVKSATVDQVNAFIVPGNTPSEKLAESLGVQVHTKSAWVGKVLNALKSRIGPALATGAGTSIGYEALARDWDHNPTWDDARRVALNTLLTSGGAMLGSSVPGMATASPGAQLAAGALGSVAMLPVKDVAFLGLTAVPEHLRIAAKNSETAAASVAAQNQANSTAGDRNKLLLGLLGSGLVLGGGALLTSMKNRADAQAAADRGKVRVTLPTKNPGDEETQIEMPLSEIALSDTLRNAIARDTKRRLRGESAGRIRRKVRPIMEAEVITPQ